MQQHSDPQKKQQQQQQQRQTTLSAARIIYLATFISVLVLNVSQLIASGSLRSVPTDVPFDNSYAVNGLLGRRISAGSTSEQGGIQRTIQILKVALESERSNLLQQKTNDHTRNSRIRRWGCGRTDLSPFIFVHIGKAGGGTIRGRISASAHNYTKLKWKGFDNSYYPIISRNETTNSTSVRYATFCSSSYPHHRPVLHKDFEGVWTCKATTPIGHMIGCPIRFDPRIHHPNPLHQKKWKMTSERCSCSSTSKFCDLVYVGHNFIGSELHWLPGPYLELWWKTQGPQAVQGDTDKYCPEINRPVGGNFSIHCSIAEHLQTLSRGQVKAIWDGEAITCNANTRKSTTETNNLTDRQDIEKIRILPSRESDLSIEGFYSRCSSKLIEEVDIAGRKWLQQWQQTQEQPPRHHTHSHARDGGEDWSNLYASLPVARVTVVRDPWSWLVSKYFWHLAKRSNRTIKCDNLEFGTKRFRRNANELSIVQWGSNETKDHGGWIHQYALGYLMYLCGEDCVSRYHFHFDNEDAYPRHAERNWSSGRRGSKHRYSHDTPHPKLLQELTLQAQHNLETGFAVVGLASDTDTFMDMVSKRIAYMNMSLNPTVEGSRHAQRLTQEYSRCKRMYTSNTTFQEEVLKLAPEVQAILDVYAVAVEVNRVQKQELEHCSTRST